MDASSSGRRKRQESSNSLAGFGGSDDEDDPHKRKRMAVSKSCGDKSLLRIDTKSEFPSMVVFPSGRGLEALSR